MTQIHSRNKVINKNFKGRSRSTNIENQNLYNYFNPIKNHLSSFKSKQDKEIITDRKKSNEIQPNSQRLKDYPDEVKNN